MRILMLAQNYAPIVGGEERLVEDLSAELVKRGHQVAVATLRPQGGEPEDFGNGVRVYPLRSSFYRVRRGFRGGPRPQAPPVPDPETVRDLRRVLRREHPEIVHAHNWLVHSYLPLDHGGDAALVLSLHDYSILCATKRLLRRGIQCTGPGILKCIECAAGHYGVAAGIPVALSTLTRRPLLRRQIDLLLPVSREVARLCGLGPADRYCVVPNFVPARPGPRSTDPRLAGLPDAPFILFLGDITEDKGAGHLIQVHRTLPKAPPLVLIGRCLLDNLEDLANVRVLGPWPHPLVEEALRRCLFVAIPSIVTETFGLVALEAAAAGRAVVASDIGGLREIVSHEESGLLVAPGDRVALRAAIERLIAEDALRERLGEAASQRALLFSADRIVPAFEAAYRTAMRTRRARAAAR